MKKIGFTLPEVLVALTIVGVIAAITIPQVVSNVEKKKVGPSLGRSVEQIDLGSQNLIQHYNDKVTDNRYYTTLSQLLQLTKKKLVKNFHLVY